MTSSLLAVAVLILLSLPCCWSSVSCFNDEECVDEYREGSRCVHGLCTNPFHNGGCLQRLMPHWKKTRVCHSDDPTSAIEEGYCELSKMDYMEVRLQSQNWESAIFGAWIVQILLSEMLEVPVTIETGLPGINSDFYNVDSSFDFGKSNDWESLKLGVEVGDCRKVKTEDPDQYRSCSHAIAETWDEALVNAREWQSEGVISPPVNLGALGGQFWFIPRFTAQRDSTLMSHFGLRGEKNRRKLAETFHRPTTWKQYCEEVSSDNCTTANGVATRSPSDEQEDNSYFVEGKYTGHFRATDENDCDKNPTTCTGHIADFPCSWASFVNQQIYHLDIALSPGGNPTTGAYNYAQLTQIWEAANATKSDVVIFWWTPEAMYQSYLGTDAEFTRVFLPPPTQECLNARIDPLDRCSGNQALLVGDTAGACDTAHHSLKKVFGAGFIDLMDGGSAARRSPAYDAMMNYEISSLHLGEIFDKWFSLGNDRLNYNPREATCQWVVDNFDLMEAFLPNSYPRVLQSKNTAADVVSQVAVGLGMATCALVAISMMITYFRRKKPAIFHAQVEFMYLVEGGLLLLGAAAVFYALEPSDGSCSALVWCSDLGYCIMLVPLAVKIDAISRLQSSGKQMQRVRLSKLRLIGSVASGACLNIGLLTAWTLIDPLKKRYHHDLTTKTTDEGETIVTMSSYCGSDDDIWIGFSLSWQVLLLIPNIVSAYMSSRVKDDLNETRSLTAFISVQFLFVTFRIAAFLVRDSVLQSDLMAYHSLIYTSACISALLIFVYPKLIHKGEDQDAFEPRPDLFLHTTILFADVVGFTAWSSVREPYQVFKFLETIYSAFDDVAERRRVFKVETVGDCYVAATGIPHEQKDHAVIMALFAKDCLTVMNKLCSELDILYGPDTAELTLRVGVHSGPVTGGFLGGKGARFQLFGDTMNTASRMESTSAVGSIQLSEDTANLLIKAGKDKWLEKRAEKIRPRGKGELQTYWLGSTDPSTNVSEVFADEEERPMAVASDSKVWKRKDRLIEWNVGVLHKLIKQIVAHRNAGSKASETLMNRSSSNNIPQLQGMPLDEVKEIIKLPEFDRDVAKKQKDSDGVAVPPSVMNQLKFYVTCIADMYREENAFHNFDHASHVVMAVLKHMSCIVSAAALELATGEREQQGIAAEKKHDHTHGITSDPLTQFACVFSALIHDIDHAGVPNSRLIDENKALARLYKNRSVAEQNSFDLAWELFMEPGFDQLRATICSDRSELDRLRQLVINSVMATDLGDQELKALRNERWDRAFNANRFDEGGADSNDDAVNRKATIVIEHLIQASDVAHTTQHWEVYREWNRNLFLEMYDAYKTGRAERDPTEFWYEGELGFFDHYVIPLSKKLRDCGVFGVSSDENLNYAMKNRERWALEGKEVVAELSMEVIQSCEEMP